MTEQERAVLEAALRHEVSFVSKDWHSEGERDWLALRKAVAAYRKALEPRPPLITSDH